jgi:hypothetical protein
MTSLFIESHDCDSRELEKGKKCAEMRIEPGTFDKKVKSDTTRPE